jgi:putative component of membrane protein insertase Oxa1/YidC/SpoIIIJ protein YidD
MIKKVLPVMVFFTFVITQISWAQNLNDDLQLISNKHFFTNEEFQYYQGQYNSAAVLQTKNRSFISKYNPVSITLKGAMFLYQNVLSPQLSKECPYEITCSNFCKESIREFGIAKGILIGADRLMRCNRISLMDVDPLTINQLTGKISDPPSKYK